MGYQVAVDFREVNPIKHSRDIDGFVRRYRAVVGFLPMGQLRAEATVMARDVFDNIGEHLN